MDHGLTSGPSTATPTTPRSGSDLRAAPAAWLGAVAAYAMFAHVSTRVMVWLDPGGDYLGSGYQVSQSLFGPGTGGLGGPVWERGARTWFPLTNADFIAAGIGEELGMIGLSAVLILSAVLMLYLVLIMRGFKAAVVCRDPFGTLPATGLRSRSRYRCSSSSAASPTSSPKPA